MSANDHPTAEGNNETARRFASDMEHLKASFSQLRTDVTEMLSSAVGAGKSGVHVAKHSAAAAVDGVKERVVSMKDKGVECAESIEHRISERPLTSALIALGVGFMLGRAVTKLFSWRR